MKKIFFLILTMMVCTISYSQDLWNGAKYGMSKFELSALFTDSTIPTSEETEKFGKDIILVIRDYEIAEDNYNVLFYSKDDMLYSIIIRPSNYKLDVRNINIIYDKLQYLLRKKYGEEISINESIKPNYAISQHFWHQGPIKIELFRTYFISGIKGYADLAELSIKYQLFLNLEDSDKL
jgi:hypothetical protein